MQRITARVSIRFHRSSPFLSVDAPLPLRVRPCGGQPGQQQLNIVQLRSLHTAQPSRPTSSSSSGRPEAESAKPGPSKPHHQSPKSTTSSPSSPRFPLIPYRAMEMDGDLCVCQLVVDSSNAAEEDLDTSPDSNPPSHRPGFVRPGMEGDAEGMELFYPPRVVLIPGVVPTERVDIRGEAFQDWSSPTSESDQMTMDGPTAKQYIARINGQSITSISTQSSEEIAAEAGPAPSFSAASVEATAALTEQIHRGVRSPPSALCKHAGKCPLCPWQHLSPSLSSQLKNNVLKRALQTSPYVTGVVDLGRGEDDVELPAEGAPNSSPKRDHSGNASSLLDESDPWGIGTKEKDKGGNRDELPPELVRSIQQRLQTDLHHLTTLLPPLTIGDPLPTRAKAAPSRDPRAVAVGGTQREVRLYFGVDAFGALALGIIPPGADDTQGKVYPIPDCLTMSYAMKRVAEAIYGWWLARSPRHLGGLGKEGGTLRHYTAEDSINTLRYVDILHSPSTDSISVSVAVTGKSIEENALRDLSDPTHRFSRLETALVKSVKNAATYPVIYGELGVELYILQKRVRQDDTMTRFNQTASHRTLLGVNHVLEKVAATPPTLEDGEADEDDAHQLAPELCVPLFSTRRRTQLDAYPRYASSQEIVLNAVAMFAATATAEWQSVVEGGTGSTLSPRQNQRVGGDAAANSPQGSGFMLDIPCGTGDVTLSLSVLLGKADVVGLTDQGSAKQSSAQQPSTQAAGLASLKGFFGFDSSKPFLNLAQKANLKFGYKYGPVAWSGKEHTLKTDTNLLDPTGSSTASKPTGQTASNSAAPAAAASPLDIAAAKLLAQKPPTRIVEFQTPTSIKHTVMDRLELSDKSAAAASCAFLIHRPYSGMWDRYKERDEAAELVVKGLEYALASFKPLNVIVVVSAKASAKNAATLQEELQQQLGIFLNPRQYQNQQQLQHHQPEQEGHPARHVPFLPRYYIAEAAAIDTDPRSDDLTAIFRLKRKDTNSSHPMK